MGAPMAAALPGRLARREPGDGRGPRPRRASPPAAVGARATTPGGGAPSTGRLPPVLIQGETGVGQGAPRAELFTARDPAPPGRSSTSTARPFPRHLLEAELFGYERGAFTDARHAKAGLFQTANHGTIFLDEVGTPARGPPGEAPEGARGPGRPRGSGSTRSEPVDVWILTASNEDLSGAAQARRFREDLYHRLAVVALDHPAAPRARRGRAPPRGPLPRPGVRGVPTPRAEPHAGGAGGAARLPVARERAGARERDGARRAPVRGAGGDRGASRAAGRARGATAAHGRRGRDRRPGSPALADALGSVERAHLVEALRQTGGNVTRGGRAARGSPGTRSAIAW